MLNVFKSVCKQCNGTGVLEQYAHVLRGACYNCEGTGQLTWENVFVVEMKFDMPIEEFDHSNKEHKVIVTEGADNYIHIIEETFGTFEEAKAEMKRLSESKPKYMVSAKLHPARKIKRTGTLDVKGGAI